MKALFFRLLVILCCCSPAVAYWQSRDSNYNKSITSSGPYVGPGDVVSGWVAWWGLRCFTTAYTGNVADIYAPLDSNHTLLTCSSGGVLNETIQALSITCAISCTVKTLYDQSGAGSCSGACDAVNATEAFRPAYTQSCIGIKPCMTFSAVGTLLAPTFTSIQAQPFALSCVANRTGATSSFADCIGSASGSSVQFGFDASANTALIYASSIVSIGGVADNSFHAMNATYNGVASIYNIDGSTGTVSPSDSSWTGGNIGGGNNNLTGKITEAGGINLNATSGNLSSLNSNQHSYWGF